MIPDDIKNPILGEVWCPVPVCKSVAYVCRNKRGYLYAQCPECGCLQPTGKPAQAYFSEFVPTGTLKAAGEKPADAAPAAVEQAAADQLLVTALGEPAPPDLEKTKRGLLLPLALIVGLLAAITEAAR